MNKLNVFNTHWCPWRYLSNWPKNIKLFFRQFKWAYQRITRGYCDFDYWDTDIYLQELMAQVIKKLADNTHGYPGNEEFPTYESWQEYLYKISNLLHYSLEELPNEYEDAWMATWINKDILRTINNPTPEEKAITDKYLNIEMENEKKKDAAVHEALQMLDHIWGHLWD